MGHAYLSVVMRMVKKVAMVKDSRTCWLRGTVSNEGKVAWIKKRKRFLIGYWWTMQAHFLTKRHSDKKKKRKKGFKCFQSLHGDKSI